MSTKINIKRTANEQLTALSKKIWEQRNLWWSIYDESTHNEAMSNDEVTAAYQIYRTLQGQHEELDLLMHLASITDKATPPWKK